MDKEELEKWRWGTTKNDKYTLDTYEVLEEVIVKLQYGDVLVLDPCYITDVRDSGGTQRWDALRVAEVLYGGDDGLATTKKSRLPSTSVGVDSGRIWALEAEFGDVSVTIDAGYSGFAIATPNNAK